MKNKEVYYTYNRGDAAGLALGAMFIYPLVTLALCLFVGWWGLMAYPVMVVLGVWSTNREARKRAEFWARDRV